MIKIGLVQINNSFSGHNYLPYSVGLLQAYCQEQLENVDQYHFLLPIYKRVKIQDAVDQLLEADMVLFSAYVWNIMLSLEVAKRLKQLKPSVVIVFGGPQVPDNAEDFLCRNLFIDVVFHKEGERVFCDFLRKMHQGDDWTDTPSISYLDSLGEHKRNENAVRIKVLDDIPSPYLSGVFDSLIEANPDEQWLAMWETNRGCPFSCTFCDWGSSTQSKVSRFDMQRLYDELDWFSDRKIEFIFCCDANFGMLQRDFDIAKKAADNKKKYGYPKALSVQNTKNARERAYKVQKFLSDHGLNKGVTLALQSLDKETLKLVKRDNISLDAYKDLQHRFTKDKIQTYTDMIIGMPGESYDSFFNGISQCIENGQHNRIQFGNLSVLPNAEMGDPAYQKKYGMKLVRTRIINIHGALSHQEEVEEYQELVGETNTMSSHDWVKTRAISWLSAFLHFNKVMQIPFICINQIVGISYRELIELFTCRDSQSYPVVTSIYEFFISEAEKIQQGGEEYTPSEEWLGIWWPADEYQLIALCINNRINDFYAEAYKLVAKMFQKKSLSFPLDLLKEMLDLNRNLIKMPFQSSNKAISLNYNIYEVYQNALIGVSTPLVQSESEYWVDCESGSWDNWQDWCREVIWYGNKKGDYLYGLRKREQSDELAFGRQINQIAGHH